MWISILNFCSLVVFLTAFLWSAPILGGFTYGMISLSQKIPWIGSLFRFFLNGTFFKLGFVAKFLSWIIGASGLLLGIGLHTWIWGVTVAPWFFWTLLVFAGIKVVNFGHQVALFQMDTYSEYFQTSRPILNKVFGEKTVSFVQADEKNHQALSRALFIDLFLPQLFAFFVAIGVIYYAIGNLGLMPLHPGLMTPPSLSQALQLSFSLIPLVDMSQPIFTGTLWEISKVVPASLLFLWSVFFLSAAQSMFMDENKLVQERQDEEALFQHALSVVASNQELQKLIVDHYNSGQNEPAANSPVPERPKPKPKPKRPRKKPPRDS